MCINACVDYETSFYSWIIYEHPNFEGRTIPIEEGDIEVTNPWGEEQQEENSPKPVVIGSLRHVIKVNNTMQYREPGPCLQSKCYTILTWFYNDKIVVYC